MTIEQLCNIVSRGAADANFVLADSMDIDPISSCFLRNHGMRSGIRHAGIGVMSPDLPIERF
jgi:hypothetical protein